MKTNMRNNDETLESFITWTKSHIGKPLVKVNGPAFPAAVVAVDFGSPTDPIKLSSEQNQELHNRMKDLTTALTGRRTVRVQFDHNNGIYWSSI